MDFQSNPPKAYRCFEELIAIGPDIVGGGAISAERESEGHEGKEEVK